MTPIIFKPYGPGQEVTVIAERITHWHLVDYNGRYGTRIYLDTEKSFLVGEWPTEVEQKLSAKMHRSEPE
jgi:hypothetical protein